MSFKALNFDLATVFLFKFPISNLTPTMYYMFLSKYINITYLQVTKELVITQLKKINQQQH